MTEEGSRSGGADVDQDVVAFHADRIRLDVLGHRSAESFTGADVEASGVQWALHDRVFQEPVAEQCITVRAKVGRRQDLAIDVVKRDLLGLRHNAEHFPVGHLAQGCDLHPVLGISALSNIQFVSISFVSAASLRVRSRKRWILPLSVLGSVSTNSIARGYL